MTASLVPVLLFFALAAPVCPPGAMPISVTGPWTVTVGPGTVTVDGEVHGLNQPVSVEIPSPPTRAVVDERHTALPVFNPKTGGWRRGTRLRRLITQETAAAGRLLPDSVQVRAEPNGDSPWRAGTDYKCDPEWATLGRLDGGAIGPETPVYVSYRYQPDRVDLLVLNTAGAVELIRGEPALGAVPLPEVPAGAVALGAVWVPGLLGLSDEHPHLEDEFCHPIAHPEVHPAEDKAAIRGAVPKTLAKLQAGKPVTIVAWGDSVTHGGGTETGDDWYQHQFLRRLQARFPESEITLLTAAWGGASSKRYLEASAGGEHDFQREVLDPKPDLVTIEFVNDAYLHGPALANHYAPVVKRIQATGAEVLFFTPHLVRQDWMGLKATAKVTQDPRPYTQDLRAFAHEQGLALADAAYVWSNLWKQGIPYMTLLANSINHPNARGHRIFADVLLRFFPKD